MTISEKVSYLKGLAEGLELDTKNSKEGKVLSAMMDILNDMALELEDVESDQAEMFDEIDAISDDLEDVENAVYDEGEDEDDDDEECFEATCPKCGDTIYFDESVLDDGEVVCPSCGEKLVFDVEEDEESGEEPEAPEDK
jgi:DNA-directed RNA polymerase subunit delta